MPNNTFIELLVRPQDENAFFFEDMSRSERHPSLERISQDDMHPADLDNVSGFPFIGFHGSYEGDYRSQAFYCDGTGDIVTFNCDNAGYLSTPVCVVSSEPPDMEVEIRHDDTQALSNYLHELLGWRTGATKVLQHMLDTSSRKE